MMGLNVRMIYFAIIQRLMKKPLYINLDHNENLQWMIL